MADATGSVRVRYYAGARAAAGVVEEAVDGATLDDLRAELVSRHDARFATVLTACSFLVDGQAVVDGATALISGATVEVLPPFAGG